MEDDDRYTRITLRIPKDLHGRLSHSAADTSKSMNAEIVARLQASFEVGDNVASIQQRDVAELSDKMERLLDAFDELRSSIKQEE